MRDLFEGIFDEEPLDPTQAARRAMRPQLRRRFYERVELEDAEEEFRIVLDGRPVKTPARRTLAAPSQALAQHLAAEWEGQHEAIDPARWSALKYRMIGPERGGRVTTVTGVPSQPYTFYMGSTGGGVWKTTDAGHSWVNLTDGRIPLGSMGAIEVALSDPNVVYVGTGSSKIRSNVSIGRGIYKSTDAGKTWTFSGLRDTGQIAAVRIHPSNPNLV